MHRARSYDKKFKSRLRLTYAGPTVGVQALAVGTLAVVTPTRVDALVLAAAVVVNALIHI